MRPPLNPRQVKFATHYGTYGNTINAINYAGYCPNCGKSAKFSYAGSHLLNKPEIQKLILEVQRQAVEAAAIDISMILGQVLKIAMESKRDDVKLKALAMLWEWCGLAYREGKPNIAGVLREFEKAFGKELARKVAEQLHPK